jgi:hypothetical protein
MGWHRALRLAPTSSDMRRRLELVPGTTASLVAPVTVWPVGADWLAWFTLGWWVCAGLASASRIPAGRAVSMAALVVVGLGLTATVTAARRARADALFVVARGDRLRVLPALGADPVAGVTAGEVVVSTDRRGAWRRVRLDDGRDGWLESRILLGLAQPRATR